MKARKSSLLFFPPFSFPLPFLHLGERQEKVLISGKGQLSGVLMNMLTQRNSNQRETLTSTRTQQRCAWVSEVFVLFVVLLCFSRSHYRQSLISRAYDLFGQWFECKEPHGKTFKNNCGDLGTRMFLTPQFFCFKVIPLYCITHPYCARFVGAHV